MGVADCDSPGPLEGVCFQSELYGWIGSLVRGARFGAGGRMLARFRACCYGVPCRVSAGWWLVNGCQVARARAGQLPMILHPSHCRVVQWSTVPRGLAGLVPVLGCRLVVAYGGRPRPTGCG